MVYWSVDQSIVYTHNAELIEAIVHIFIDFVLQLRYLHWIGVQMKYTKFVGFV